MKTVEIGGETFEIVNDSFVKGCYGDRYFNACEREREAHKDDQPTDEQKKETVIEYKGYKCRVFYDFVPPYGYGSTVSMNHWTFIMHDKGYSWRHVLSNVETLEEAVEKGRPWFEAAIDRLERKLNEDTDKS